MTKEDKTSLYECIKKQYPDPGLYKVSRLCEWLETNGCSPEKMGYSSFRDLAEDFTEMFSFQRDNNDDFIQIKPWQAGEESFEGALSHPADRFFGSKSIVLNDDIIEITQQSLYALTKVLGNGMSVQQMKQEVYRCFEEAKLNNKLDFFAERYTFPIGYCLDGALVNGVITKNSSLSPNGKSLYFAFEKTQTYCSNYLEQRPTVQEIPQEYKDEIYQLLRANFPVEQPIHMATISKFLADNGVDRIKYGCYKMKDFLRQLPFLSMRDTVLGGVPQVIITIKDSVGSYTDEPRTAAGNALRNGCDRNCYGQFAVTVPSGRLSDFCYLPSKPLSILVRYLEDSGKTATLYSIIETLNADFAAARENITVRENDSKLVFPMRYQKKDGTHITITLKPSTYRGGKSWFLYYVDTGIADKRFVEPGKQLESFAFLGSWSNFLSELAAKAVDEEWDFGGHRLPNGAREWHYSILIQYVKYTFSRLIRENKVCISGDRQFAAFNTGLVDNHYDDIYACFIPNEPGCDTEWKYAGFCTAASGGLGKQLVNSFNPLPAPASYFTRSEDLFFDSTKQLHTDFEHIIIDNIRRLPIQFLYEQFFDNSEAREIIERIRMKNCGRGEENELYENLKQIITENSRLFLRIQNRIKDAIELAKKRVRWNYRTAVPSYFPKCDTMSFMLPLYLTETEENRSVKPDVALVVELTNSGSYQGRTILTLPQAYIDARLVCRLTGDWLNPDNISELIRDNDEQPEEIGY